MESLENEVMSYIYLYNLALKQESIDEDKYPSLDIILNILKDKLKELRGDLTYELDKCKEVIDLKGNRYIPEEAIEKAKEEYNCIDLLRWNVIDIVGYD